MAESRTPRGQDGPIAYLCVSGGAAAIDFYTRALGAEEVYRIAQPDGKVGHAELKIGNGTIFLADEYPEGGFLSPKTIGGTPIQIHLYVDDVDAVATRMTEAGATNVRPVETQFYGDRGGSFDDPFGHRWWIATRVEDLSVDEMKKRAREMFG